MGEWQVPRCGHGNILLACPESDCPEQDAEIAANQAMIDAYHARQEQEALREWGHVLAPGVMCECPQCQRRTKALAVGLPIKERDA